MWRPLHVTRQLGNDYLAGYNTSQATPIISGSAGHRMWTRLALERGSLRTSAASATRRTEMEIEMDIGFACLSIGDMKPT